MVIRAGHMLALLLKANKNSPEDQRTHHPPSHLAAAGNKRVSSKPVFFPDLFWAPLAKKLHRRQIFVAHFFQIGVARRLFLAAANIFTLPAEEVTRADGRESPGAKSGLMRSCCMPPLSTTFAFLPARRKNFNCLFSPLNANRCQHRV